MVFRAVEKAGVAEKTPKGRMQYPYGHFSILSNPLLRKKSPFMRKAWYKKIWVWILVVFFLFFFAFAGIVFWEARRMANVEVFGGGAEPYNPETAAMRFKIESSGDPELGPKNAPVTIVEFGDFECPFCRRSYSTIRELERQYTGKIRLVYRDFPVFSVHKRAMLAHRAANCAFEQEKFWAMHDKIFENQEDMEEADLKKYALQIGLDEKNFASCLDDDTKEREIMEDLNDGVALGVKGTPTWFVNGYKIEGDISLAQWQGLISSMLAAYERQGL